MILPHALFVGVSFAVKLLFPSIVTWLARDTYTISILSQVYPWLSTVGLLFQYRHVNASASANANVNATPSNAQPKQQQPATPRTPLKDHQSMNSSAKKQPSANNKAPATPKIYPRTTPQTPKHQPTSQAPPKTPVQRLLAAGRVDKYSVEQDAKYWFQYWNIYCLFTGIQRVLYLIPIAGRIMSKSKLLQNTSVELELFFYLWIYGMSSILTSTSSSDADLERSYLVRPLPFLMKRISPIVHRIYKTTSNLVSPELWTMLVTKVKSFLSVAVMVRILSEKSQTRLLELLEYAHPFLVPAVTLLMPGFVTEYGVLYVKTIVPSAKQSKSLSETMDSLQYWILHALLSSLLSWWSGLLWWIPFSTHLIFVLWCHLQYTASGYYNCFEQELQAFGLLPQGQADVLSVDKTMTATMFRTIAKSLPSASDADKETIDLVDQNETIDLVGSQDGDSKAPATKTIDSSALLISNKKNEDNDYDPNEDSDDDGVMVHAEKKPRDEKENPVRRSTRARKPNTKFE